MSDRQSVADRFEIEALRGEFTDAVTMRDYDRLAALFTPDGSVRMPHISAEATSQEQIRAGVEQMPRRTAATGSSTSSSPTTD